MKANKAPEKTNYIVYKASKLETFLSRLLSYHLPFISKKKRIRLRNYFKYAYQRRLMKDLTNVLKEIKDEDPTSQIQLSGWNEEDYSWAWEVIDYDD